jgi:hypothetical protein
MSVHGHRNTIAAGVSATRRIDNLPARAGKPNLRASVGRSMILFLGGCVDSR